MRQGLTKTFCWWHLFELEEKSRLMIDKFIYFVDIKGNKNNCTIPFQSSWVLFDFLKHQTHQLRQLNAF